ncbi:RNA polymerase sigma-70 factor [Chitinophaga japonensis]|uniref:RNA polymerase sigma-70 factor (ECF subfamily) n=1 Tax=Chitinophaga japonensis TaxID=104662 RepID=A0A562T0F3_CHIJA|nr:RNA polymerase sigma-70 factor [Chitinophaga japonensis]TWI87001.1 RNA polymerase sigma-70 factor (ECF subfamily) [Chitinophaga japonensis]
MPTDKTYLHALWQKVCHHNDQQAFQSLFELLYLRLVNFCIAYVHSREAAEETVGDVFLKLWINRAATGEIAHVETYLFTAVRHQSLNYLRKFSTYHVISTAQTQEIQVVDTASPADATEWKELLFRLHQAVDALPPERRRIFRLVKEEGFTCKEVAGILQLSPRTVETQLFKAVKQLRGVLGVGSRK